MIDCPLDQAVGCRLTEDIRAPEPSPRYTNSAMDGYGARWEDLAGRGGADRHRGDAPRRRRYRHPG
ncbi:MAG: hypothetical protein RQ753_08715 [Desulfurivibrionaceae bacterium]|nr:hypothetical protein [Desulfurivibrionaceae bacterium]